MRQGRDYWSRQVAAWRRREQSKKRIARSTVCSTGRCAAVSPRSAARAFSSSPPPATGAFRQCGSGQAASSWVWSDSGVGDEGSAARLSAELAGESPAGANPSVAP